MVYIDEVCSLKEACLGFLKLAFLFVTGKNPVVEGIMTALFQLFKEDSQTVSLLTSGTSRRPKPQLMLVGPAHFVQHHWQAELLQHSKGETVAKKQTE